MHHNRFITHTPIILAQIKSITVKGQTSCSELHANHFLVFLIMLDSFITSLLVKKKLPASACPCKKWIKQQLNFNYNLSFPSICSIFPPSRGYSMPGGGTGNVVASARPCATV